MELFEYAQGVKSLKRNQLVTKFTTLSVGANDLIANLDRLEASKIDLGHVINSWAITKSVSKALESSGYRGVSFNYALKSGAKTIVALAPLLSKLIQGYREDIWSGSTLTLRQANLLNIGEHIEHWLKYTNMVYSVLMTMHTKGEQAGMAVATKADLKLLNGTLELYKAVTVQLMKGSKVLFAHLEGIPDVEISETSLAVLEGTNPDATTDLLKQGFGIHNVNPVFWYQLAEMNLNVARIDKMQKDNELFAMKISQAVNQKNGVNDAELEHQIEVWQDAIIKNVNTIETIEKKYA